MREEVAEILKRNKQRGGGLKDIRYHTNDGGAVAVWSEKDGYIPENIARVVAEDQE